MCQLPLGYQESRGSRWVRRLGISVSVQASLLPIKEPENELFLQPVPATDDPAVDVEGPT
ncbi:hypothetical protein NQZ68_036530 [Dissostichus eleginoides]|nr:hypothetical protein NQZ68_036530 [Dissostichus eleginoides]